MGFFNLWGTTGGNINSLVEEARETQGSYIIDVRTSGEFNQGHIKGALNIPLDQIQLIEKKIGNLSAPLYLYCASGARSSSAVRFLKNQGFEKVTNMGGISSWRGEIVKGAK